MIRRHIVESGLIALCVILTAIVLMMWWASQYAHFITTAMMIMIILGLMVGSLVPNIILTWLAISLTTIGSAILLLGYVVMDNSIQIMLLFFLQLFFLPLQQKVPFQNLLFLRLP